MPFVCTLVFFVKNPRRVATCAARAHNPAVTPPPKRLHIKTYGCQMNVYDSGRMADLLRPLGYVETDTPEGADVVVLITCHIRENATE